MSSALKLSKFNDNVVSKYKIYNSIFMTLPYDSISNTGVLLPLFHEVCKKGFSLGENPTQIVDYFFKKYQENPTEEEKIHLLFRFIQYIERQIVLFDAIEDAEFENVNNMEGIGTLRSSKDAAFSQNKKEELQQYLREFKVRIVLTAHPTQFYPGNVLGIITDLDKAIQNDDLLLIKNLLAQLGKTPFFKKQKPTPYDEAVSLIWYLENVLYHSVSTIYNFVQQHVYDGEVLDNEIIDLGFWPGGDRDGNPFVTTEITLKVAERLRQTILKNYHRDIRKLRRRLTFKGIEEILIRVEKRLNKHTTKSYKVVNFSSKILLEELNKARVILVEEHKSLFLEELDDLIHKVSIFGFHFATLDIRQDSRVHHNAFTNMVQELLDAKDTTFPENYLTLSEKKQVAILSEIKGAIDPSIFSDEMLVKTLKSIQAIKEIQSRNGKRGANRYIISNNQTALNVMQTFAMLNLSGFGDVLPVDVIPLFETVDDLQNAASVMRTLYSNKSYRNHVSQRKDKQTIMLGFSDGTKDGGYLMANWSIFKAKEALTAISREFDIEVIFFDGRGGPPARGGGKTHQFYASLGPTIEDKEIRRSYSICSSPNSGELKIAIKRVENGVFSTYAISSLKTGDIIEVHEPEGKFILEPTRRNNYLGIVAGSGITPVLSMIKTVLQQEPSSSFTLIYGNKSSDETMFKTELDALSQAYDTRFNLEYVFSRQNEEGSLFGRIDKGLTNYFIKNIYKNWSFKTAFLCGPEEMIKTVSTTLKENHFKESQILFELFTASINEPPVFLVLT